MAVEKPDVELLSLTAAGDQGAFARLVRQHQGRVLNLAYRFSRNRQDAEDLAQEVFLRVWRYAGSFRGEAAFGTWLYRLAVNVCLNHRLRKKKRPEPLPLPEDLESGTEAAEAGSEARQRENLLIQAMAALPARQKMALVLVSFEDKSYEEIAAAMEVSVPAVESLLFRARKNLAEILRPLRKKGEM